MPGILQVMALAPQGQTATAADDPGSVVDATQPDCSRTSAAAQSPRTGPGTNPCDDSRVRSARQRNRHRPRWDRYGPPGNHLLQLASPAVRSWQRRPRRPLRAQSARRRPFQRRIGTRGSVGPIARSPPTCASACRSQSVRSMYRTAALIHDPRICVAVLADGDRHACRDLGDDSRAICNNASVRIIPTVVRAEVR